MYSYEHIRTLSFGDSDIFLYGKTYNRILIFIEI